jgi:integrase
MAARTKLTKGFLDGRTASERDQIWWDSEVRGLGFKIAAKRADPSAKTAKIAKTRLSRSFVLQYRMPNTRKTRRYTIGQYGELTLEQARSEAQDLWVKIRAGADPMGARQAARAADRAGTPRPTTIDDLIDEYLKREGEGKRSAAEIRRSLDREVRPVWGKRRIGDITRRDVVEILDTVVDRGSPVAANRLKARISRLFNFAIERGLIDANPCGRMKPPGGKESARKRELSGAEIKVFCDTLSAAPMEPGIKRALRFMLATGQRRSEVLGLRQIEVNGAESGWLLPAERAKNGREHWVPLSQVAWAILEEMTPDPATGFYFASPHTGQPYNGRSVDHALRDLFKPRTGKGKKKNPTPPLLKGKMEPFTPHDLRRTMATRLRELGVSRDDVALLLNHKDTSVTGKHYDQWTARPEKIKAMGKWSNFLRPLLEPPQEESNVVNMRG